MPHIVLPKAVPGIVAPVMRYPETAGPLNALAEVLLRGPSSLTRAEGADDRTIHDTVLIAAAFRMYNRYVDGLATWAPSQPEVYAEIGARLATSGYVDSVQPEPASAGRE